MEKLDFEKAYRIFCECEETSETACKNCPLFIIKDENGQDLCYSFCRIDDGIIDYNKGKFSTEE